MGYAIAILIASPPLAEGDTAGYLPNNLSWGCRSTLYPSAALMYGWKGIIFLLASFPVSASASGMSLSQCLVDVISCANSSNSCIWNISNTTALSVLRTSRGDSVTSTDAANALSYAGCITYCGTGLEEFSWTSFAQEYAAWLLPYLALVSQLPFGAPRRTDNLMSAILTLGSPALAGYSLYMTLLNTRWVNDQLFAGVDYPSTAVRRSVVRVLSSLQQVPLRIHPGESARFESLVVHPDNDNWWNTLAAELDFSNKWSIASATSITWVVIAYLLTVADSLNNVAENLETSGQGAGSGWLWLLPVVVGWLVLSPKCDSKRVHDAYHKANREVFVPDSSNPITAHTPITSNFGLTIIPSPDPDWPNGSGITSPDELRIPPVFNYARIFSWYHNVYLTSLFYRAALEKSNKRVGVDGGCIHENVRDDVPRRNRLGTPNQILQYCRPGYTGTRVLWPRGLFFNMIVASLMALQLQWGTTGAALIIEYFSPTIGLGCRSLAHVMYGALSTVVWMLLVLSSVLGYYAHNLLHDYPVIDLEWDAQRTPPGAPSKLSKCNSTASSSSTRDGPDVSPVHSTLAIPMLEIHAPHGLVEQENVQSDSKSDASCGSTTDTRRFHTRRIRGQIMLQVANCLRWIGKSLAIVNAIGTIANSVFQYAGVYSNCYCDSSVFTWGASAFDVLIASSSDIELARRAWIGGLALALSSCACFVGSIYLLRDALPQ